MRHCADGSPPCRPPPPRCRGAGSGKLFAVRKARILASGINCGFSLRKPPRIFPLSPTNIMPSSGSSLFSAMSSSGTGGLMPPSYQKMSRAARSPLGANLMRIVQAAGNE